MRNKHDKLCQNAEDNSTGGEMKGVSNRVES